MKTKTLRLLFSGLIAYILKYCGRTKEILFSALCRLSSHSLAFPRPLSPFRLLPLLVAFLSLPSPSVASISQTIKYQGFLVSKTSNLPVDTPQDLRFVFYDAPAGGTPLFTENRCQISVSKGRYEVEIGSMTPGEIPAAVFQNNSAVWLEIQIDPDHDCGGVYEILSPRIRLQAAPYAFESLHASTASSVSAGAISNSGQIADGVISLAKLNQSGCALNNIPLWNGTNWVCAAAGGGSAYSADEQSLHLEGAVFTARPSSVTLQGNTFNAPGRLLLLDSGGAAPIANGGTGAATAAGARSNLSAAVSGSNNDITALTALTAGGLADGAVYGQDVADSTITLSKLNRSGCALNEIPKWNGTNWGCAADAGGSSYTADEAALHLAGTVFSALPSSITLQGNTFNGSGQLLRLDGSGLAPLANLGGLTNTQIAAGTFSNITVPAANVASGSLGSSVIVSSIAAGAVSSSAQIADGTIYGQDIAVSTITLDKLNQSGCGLNEIPKWNGTNWACGTDNGVGSESDPLAILKQATLQTGATFYVSSGTVNTFYVGTSISLPDDSIQVADIGPGTLPTDVLASSVAANGVRPGSILAGAIVNADINNAADIAISKLATSGSLGGNVIVSSIAVGAVNSSNQIVDGTIANADLAGSIDDAKLNTIATAGKVSDSALSSNVALLNANQLISGVKTFSSTATITGQDASGYSLKLSSGMLATGGTITAGLFVGSGAGLTGVTGATDNTKVLKTGDFMSGQLTTASTMTVQGSAFSVGGSTLVVSNGNIGIGTTNPGATLDVAGDINTTNGYQIGGSTVVAILPGTGSLGIGVNAGRVDTGNYNIFVGRDAGYNRTTGGFNSFLGYQAGYNSTAGQYNSFFGAQAGFSNSGLSNTFVGAFAGYANTTGRNNSFLGDSAGSYNTTGQYNSFFGSSAGIRNTTGQYNSVFGNEAGYYNQTGSANAILGAKAGLGVFSGSFSSSTLIGYGAGYGLSTGSDNILLGWQAGSNLTTGSGNIIIGYNENAPAAGTSNLLDIGGAIYGDLSNKNVGIGTTSPSYRLHISSGAGEANEVLAVSTGTSNIFRVKGTGEVYAGKYYGDGSALTGISAGLNPSNNVNWTGIHTWQSSATFVNPGFSIGGSTFVVANGNVGIGTANPAARMDIQDINAADSYSLRVGTSATAYHLAVSTMGNVGIGTTSPESRLHVLSPSLSSDQIAAFYSGIDQDGEYNWINVGRSASAGQSFAMGYRYAATPGDEGGFLNVYGDGAQALFLRRGGNVGIGTTSPAEKLTIDNGWIKFNTAVTGIKWQDGSTSTTAAQGGGGGGMSGTGTTGKIAKFTGPSAVGDSIITESGGNIGIGTTSPARPLQVEGNNSIISRFVRPDGTNTQINIESGSGGGLKEMSLGVYDLGGGVFRGEIGTDTNQPLELRTNSIARVAIDSGGNVGVATSAPAGLFTVGNGTMVVTAAGSVGIGTASPWSSAKFQARATTDENLYISGHAGGAVPDGMVIGSVNDAVSVNKSLELRGSPIVMSVGNVGIGTTNPAQPLQISAAESVLRLTATGANGTSWDLHSRMTSGDFRITPSPFTTPAVVISSNTGNVGIGTTSPGTKLHISNAAVVNGTVITLDGDSGTAAYKLGIDGTGSESALTFISINDNERMRITNTGNVGIGTTNPAEKLTIENGWIKFNTAITGIKWQDGSTSTTAAQGGGGGGMGGIGTTGKIAKFTGPNAVGDSVITESGGNIGIGTTSPGAKLDIQDISATDSYSLRAGTSATAYHLVVSTMGNVGIGTDAPTAALTVKGAGTGIVLITQNPSFTGYGLLSLNGIANNTDYNITSSPGDKNLYFNRPTGNAIVFRENNSGSPSQMSIISGGNVGIGTDGPAELLDVYGGRLRVTSTAGNNGLAIGLRYNSTAGRSWLGGVNDVNGGLYFSGNDNGAEHMRITNSGNVGIGTTNPGYKLDVNGDMNLAAGSNYRIGGVIQSGTSKWTAGAGDDIYRSLGNVGIGTASPGGKLEINSTSANHVKLTGGSVDVGIWTDSADRLRIADWATGTKGININTSSGNVGVATSAPAGLFTVGNGTMVVTAAGNVGIGMTSPGERLTISAPGSGYGGLLITGGGSGGIGATVDSGSNNQQLQYRMRRSGSGFDTDWYMYSPASSTDLRFYNSGDKLTFQAGGNVGIGTTNPGQKLTIQTGSGNYGLLHTDGARELVTYIDTTAAYIGTKSNDDFQILTNNSAGKFVVKAGGNVGIGTANAANKLHVEGAGGGSAGIYLNNAVPSATSYTLYNNAGTLTWNGTPLATGSSVSGTTGRIPKFTAPSSLGDSLFAETAGAVTLLSNATMTVTGAEFSVGISTFVVKTGNVGIGTTAPNAKLEIYGSDGVNTIESLRLDNSNTAGKGTKIVFYQSGTPTEVGRIANFYDGTKWNMRMGSYLTPETVTITQDGNVGIGTTVPTAKLHVLDAAAFTGIVSESTNAGGVAGIVAKNPNRIWSARIRGDSNNGFAITDETAGQYRMMIDTSGNIGIATAAPAGLFTVGNGTMVITAAGNVGILTTAPDAVFGVGNVQSGTRFHYNRSVYGSIFGGFNHLGDSGGFEIYNINNSVDRSIRFSNGASYAGRMELVRIDNNGNVGIGTTSPTNKLHVEGTGAGSAGIYINNAVPSATSYTLYNNAGTLTWNGTPLATGSSVSGTTGRIPKFTTPSSLGDSVMFENAGNVGIGTTSPGVLLDVNKATGQQIPNPRIRQICDDF